MGFTTIPVPITLVNQQHNGQKEYHKLQKIILNENKRMLGRNHQKPTKLDGNTGNTTTLSYHPYILCHLHKYAL